MARAVVAEGLPSSGLRTVRPGGRRGATAKRTAVTVAAPRHGSLRRQTRFLGDATPRAAAAQGGDANPRPDEAGLRHGYEPIAPAGHRAGGETPAVAVALPPVRLLAATRQARPRSLYLPERGFTLVEVLVALMVMAVLAAMAWQGVDGIVRTRDESQRRLEQTLRIATVLAQWELDLAALQESAAVPALAFDGATLRLTRRAPGGLQVVAWTLRPGSPGWLRWAGPVVATETALQESWLRSQQLRADEPGQLRTLDGVDQWQIYFYRGSAWANAQSSGDLAPASGGAAGAPARQLLPSGVRLVLGFSPAVQGVAASLTRDIALAPAWP